MVRRATQTATARRTRTATKAKYLYVVRMDIPPEKEAEFNDLYNNEHVPALLKVPGVLGAARYRTDEPGQPKYMAVYELESPDVPDSEQWRKASDSGLWPTRIRPYTQNRSRVTYKLIYPGE